MCNTYLHIHTHVYLSEYGTNLSHRFAKRGKFLLLCAQLLLCLLRCLCRTLACSRRLVAIKLSAGQRHTHGIKALLMRQEVEGERER